MKTLVIMQPTYLPYLGWFDLMRHCDEFVVYDCAQFSKQSWQQRNRVRDKNGEIMLTVPVVTKGLLGQRIDEVRLDPTSNWAKKHLDTIRFNYAKSRNFASFFPKLEAVYAARHETLLALDMALIELGRAELGIATKLTMASALKPEGGEVPALVDMCRKTGATRYLSTPGSKVYIDQNNLFPAAGIELVYHSFAHPQYVQRPHKDFISHLAFIDYLFHRDNP